MFVRACNDGVFTSVPVRVRSAPAAAELAGVTYRQLDHWERQGWVTASHVEQIGGRRVRRYGDDDVVRLAALRHLAQSGRDVGSYGPAVGQVDVPAGHFLVVGADIEVVAARSLTAAVTRPGRWTVFDPGPVRSACARDGAAMVEPEARGGTRRSA